MHIIPAFRILRRLLSDARVFVAYLLLIPRVAADCKLAPKGEEIVFITRIPVEVYYIPIIHPCDTVRPLLPAVEAASVSSPDLDPSIHVCLRPPAVIIGWLAGQARYGQHQSEVYLGDPRVWVSVGAT